MSSLDVQKPTTNLPDSDSGDTDNGVAALGSQPTDWVLIAALVVAVGLLVIILVKNRRKA